MSMGEGLLCTCAKNQVHCHPSIPRRGAKERSLGEEAALLWAWPWGILVTSG